MPIGLTIPLILLLVVVAVLRTLYWVFLWQLKEYRTDRMRDFLSTPSGRAATINKWTIGELVSLLLLYPGVYLFLSKDDGFSVSLALIVLVMLFFGLEVVQLLRARQFPVWTTKALLLSGISVVVVVGLPLSVLSFADVSVLAASIFISPLLVSFIVLLLQPLTVIQKQRIIEAAKEKMKDLNPIVIGVTGSYGKTLTKQYLESILSKQFSVLATPKNVNVDIGVAQTILRDLKPSHDVFIVEMGAYKEGEIDAICDIVSPIIGVLTVIAEQHLALFGSLEAIQRTKGELLRSLPETGVAVVNGDNAAAVQAANDVNAKVKFFSAQEVAHVYASDTVAQPHRLNFTLNVGGSAVPVSPKLYGAQVIPAVLAAVTVAQHLGVSIDQITSAINGLESVDGTMHLRRGYDSSTIIDDSYNANPDGFLAALDYLALFEDKRKIVVTPGMLELGTESDSKHRTVGSRIGEVADILIVTKKDSAEPLAVAAKQTGLQSSQIVVNDSSRDLIEGVLSTITTDDVILIAGRAQQSIRDFLINE